MAVIEESGMRFGDYPDEDLFWIERSYLYQKRLMPNGVKTCEFILQRNSVLYFVEAKTSCPNQIKAETTQEKKEKYDKYINDIKDKIENSLAVYAAIITARQTSDNVPAILLEHNLSHKRIKLFLVIKNAKKEWLDPLRYRLLKSLKAHLRIWNINDSDFVVINETYARKMNLII